MTRHLSFSRPHCTFISVSVGSSESGRGVMELSAHGLPQAQKPGVGQTPFSPGAGTLLRGSRLAWLWQNPVLLLIGLGTELPYQLRLGAIPAPGHHARGPFHLQGLQWSISVRFNPSCFYSHCQDSPPPRQLIQPSSYLQKPFTVAPRLGLDQVAGRCVGTRGQNLVAVLDLCHRALQLFPAAPTRTLFWPLEQILTLQDQPVCACHVVRTEMSLFWGIHCPFSMWHFSLSRYVFKLYM